MQLIVDVLDDEVLGKVGFNESLALKDTETSDGDSGSFFMFFFDSFG
jgi:hypothetical protein